MEDTIISSLGLEIMNESDSVEDMQKLASKNGNPFFDPEETENSDKPANQPDQIILLRNSSPV